MSDALLDDGRVARLTRVGTGRFRAWPDPRYWNQIGPFGGWLAAVALRAMRAEVAAEVLPRSVAVDFFGVLDADAFEVTVQVLREQRTVVAARAELAQRGRTCVSAMGMFGRQRHGPSLSGDSGLPPMPPPDRLASNTALHALAPFVRQFDYRIAAGSPFEGAAAADTGGWLRFRDGDAPSTPESLLLMADAWYPPIWATLSEPVPVTTLSMSVVFCNARALRPDVPMGFVAARHRTRGMSDGYATEDGALWLPDGSLVLQTQQLTWIDFSKAPSAAASFAGRRADRSPSISRSVSCPIST